jgi:hypothetical protein
MIDPGHPRLSIVRQCELASISRSSFYRKSTAENEEMIRLQMARRLSRNGRRDRAGPPLADRGHRQFLRQQHERYPLVQCRR